jgi:hypothetical protein
VGDQPTAFEDKYVVRQLFANRRLSRDAVLAHSRWPYDWVYPFPTVWVMQNRRLK